MNGLDIARARMGVLKEVMRWPAGAPSGQGGRFRHGTSGFSRSATAIPKPPAFVTHHASVKAENEAHAKKMYEMAKAGDLAGVKAYSSFSSKSSKLVAYKAALIAALSAEPKTQKAPAPAPSPAPKAGSPKEFEYDQPLPMSDKSGLIGVPSSPWQKQDSIEGARKALTALNIEVKEPKSVEQGKHHSDKSWLNLMNAVGHEVARLDAQFPGIGEAMILSREACHGSLLGSSSTNHTASPTTIKYAKAQPVSAGSTNSYGRPFGVQGYEPPEGSFASVVRHELAHALDYFTDRKNRSDLKKVAFTVDGGKPTDSCGWAKRNVSDYSAAQNYTSEAIAEMFSLRYSPNYGKPGFPRLPAQVEQILENLANRKYKKGA